MHGRGLGKTTMQSVEGHVTATTATIVWLIDPAIHEMRQKGSETATKVPFCPLRPQVLLHVELQSSNFEVINRLVQRPLAGYDFISWQWERPAAGGVGIRRPTFTSFGVCIAVTPTTSNARMVMYSAKAFLRLFAHDQ